MLLPVAPRFLCFSFFLLFVFLALVPLIPMTPSSSPSYCWRSALLSTTPCCFRLHQGSLIFQLPSSSFVFLTLIPLIPLLLSTVLVAALILRSAEAGSDFSWIPISKPETCRGLIAECMAEGGEFDMDSEVSRRILATTKYISYAALQEKSVPCSRRGASYYNFRPGAQSNPYTRSSIATTRCMS